MWICATLSTAASSRVPACRSQPVAFRQPVAVIANGYSEELALPASLQVVDSPWAARQAVREQIAHGTDWIKLYAAYQFHFTEDGKMVVPPTFTAEEVNAIVDEAHRRGHKVSCHAFGGRGSP